MSIETSCCATPISNATPRKGLFFFYVCCSGALYRCVQEKKATTINVNRGKVHVHRLYKSSWFLNAGAPNIERPAFVFTISSQSVHAHPKGLLNVTRFEALSLSSGVNHKRTSWDSRGSRRFNRSNTRTCWCVADDAEGRESMETRVVTEMKERD
jgi:hypothetical protein